MLNLLSGSTVQILIAIICIAVAIVFAIVLHEWAHAKMAIKMGDLTPKMYKRDTFNPARHLDLMGTICFIFAGFGWAKPVPVNPFNYTNYKKGNALVSLAGIIANVCLGIVASFFYVLFAQVFAGSSNFFAILLVMFFSTLTFTNFSLAIFNLLPIPPLDGFNLLNSFTKPNNKFMNFMRRNSMIIILIIAITGAFSGFITFVMDIVTGGLIDLWLLLLGGI